jgi:hypothetical protein
MTTIASDPTSGGTPYRAAVAVFFVVFAGYVWTLAPTVTFWDAGEFLAAAKILGIPHPPGTPVFVFLANVWAKLVPIGEFALRVNLMTAVFSAASAALMFLVVFHGLRSVGQTESKAPDPGFVYGGAGAAALVSAFAFTVWQNSNESEVYMVAAFSMSAIAWLAWVWRKHRGKSRAPHILLLIVYLGAFSVGNHLLTLLIGPALIVFMWHVMKTEPMADDQDRAVEWAHWAVVVGVWALLIGTGLGSTTLFSLGAVAFAVAAMFAIATGGWRFALGVLLVAAVGVSTYLFLYIRAGLGPFINEADPSTWESLLAVIRREQYPPRLPTDNPIYASGFGNPGRTLDIIALQILNYLQYFDWQWSNGLAPTQSVFAPIRLPFTLAFTSLGIYGAALLRERNRSVFWLLLIIFLTTGPALMGYMNFKPGFSIGYDQFPDANMHEVRERDYFFTVSFQLWGIFAGIGIAGLYRTLRDVLRANARAVKLAPAVFALAAVPFVLNFKAASRAHRPEAVLARDFPYDLLQSIEPYGIVFTNGDNDTFPLWYAQEVEAVRQDVVVVNLSLGNTDWYIRQLRDNPLRAFDPAQAPWYADLAPSEIPQALHTMRDDEIAGVAAQLLPQDFRFQVGEIDHVYPRDTPLLVKDVLILRLILENAGRRPIYFSTTAGSGNWVQLGRYLTQEGLALRLNVDHPPDSTRLVTGLLGVPLDVPRTDSLAWHIYRYARLFEVDSLDLDPTNRNIATNLSLPFLSLGQAYDILGQRQRGMENFARSYHLSPSPELRSLIDMSTAQEVTPMPGDSPLRLEITPGADTSEGTP